MSKRCQAGPLVAANEKASELPKLALSSNRIHYATGRRLEPEAPALRSRRLRAGWTAAKRTARC